MEKKQLRERLKKLGDYVKELDFPAVFLEEGAEAPMDSLLIPLQIGEELSVDLSCNFVELPDLGEILQFYGQIVLDEMLEEAPKDISDEEILRLLNALNQMIPIGQLLYLFDEADGSVPKVIGMRYTMLTELDGETEWKKCAIALALLMQIYELLCSSLLLLVDGSPVENIIDKMKEFLGL